MTVPQPHTRTIEFIGGPLDGTMRECDFLPLSVAVCGRPAGYVGTASGLSLDRPDVVVHEYAVDDSPNEQGIYPARYAPHG